MKKRILIAIPPQDEKSLDPLRVMTLIESIEELGGDVKYGPVRIAESAWLFDRDTQFRHVVEVLAKIQKSKIPHIVRHLTDDV